MRNYANTPRAQLEKSEELRYLIAPGEPPEGTDDPELRAAREKLIRRMAGRAWSDCTALQKVGRVLFCAISWLCCALAFGCLAGVILLVFSALTGVPPEGNYDGAHGSCPMCEFVIHGTFYIGVVASTVVLVWGSISRERRIRWLGGVSNVHLLREYEAWCEEQHRLAEQEQRRRDLDYQAERIGFWTDHYSRRG